MSNNQSFGSFRDLSDSGQLDFSQISYSQMLAAPYPETPPFNNPSKNEHYFRSKDTLQSLVQSCLCSKQCQSSQQKSIKSCNSADVLECKNQKLRPDRTISKSSPSFGFDNINLSLEKQSTLSFSGTTLIARKIVASEKENKKRIRWTEDLHMKFIMSVGSLGGAKKATPKAILKLMDCDGLTIFHVKSHLQKYRVSQLVQQATEGATEQHDTKMNMHIVDALRLQMDVQKHLCRQLENQKKLQMRIEEQAKQLDRMIKSQLKPK